MAKNVATKRPTRNSEKSALAKKAGKHTSTERASMLTEGGVGEAEIGKIQALLKSKTTGGVTLGLQMLQTLNAGEIAFKTAFAPSVVKTIVESGDFRKWQPVVEYLSDLPAIRESFEASIVSHFSTLSKQSQRKCVEAGIADLRPRCVRVFKELVHIVNARSLRDDDPMFTDLSTLSDGAAEVLADYGRELILPITNLTDNAARWLGKCNNWVLMLPALTALSDVAAAQLARWQGSILSLSGLPSISDSAATFIAKHKGQQLDLSGLQNISPRTAASLARYKGDELDLSGLRSISDTVASSLAKFKGDKLELGGLQDLSDAAAAQLAKYKGSDLKLNGIRSLSDKAIESLSKGAGSYVHLDGLRTVSDRAAQILGQSDSNGPWLSLDGLAGRLSSTAAEALLRGGHELASGSRYSSSQLSVEIVFSAPITLEMIKTQSRRGGGRGYAAVVKPTHFCRIVLAGKSYTVTQGRIGTAGQSVKKSFDTPRSALKSFTRAKFKKNMEGFEVVDPTS
jgi:predicted DNA-binding WGR domain protein